MLALRLEPNSELSAETKELMKTFAAALTSFVTAAFISWVGEQNDNRIANRIFAENSMTSTNAP